MRGPIVLGLLLLLAIGLGVAGATMVLGDQQDAANAPAIANVAPTPEPPAATPEREAAAGGAPSRPSSSAAGSASAAGGRVPMIPASPGGVQYVGGKTVTLAARRGGTSFSAEVPARIPTLASVSAVMRGTTASSEGGGGSIASVYIASGDRCPPTENEANDRTGTNVARFVTGNALRRGAFRFGDLPTISLQEGPAIACAYLGAPGKPALTASKRILIAGYRAGLYAKNEAAFPSGTYVASGFDVIGAESVSIRITRGTSPYGEHDEAYVAPKVVARRMRLNDCEARFGEERGNGSTSDVALSKTSPDLPPVFIGQTTTSHYEGPDKGDLVGGFAGDGQLHGTLTVDRTDGNVTCGGSVAFVAHRVG